MSAPRISKRTGLFVVARQEKKGKREEREEKAGATSRKRGVETLEGQGNSGLQEGEKT